MKNFTKHIIYIIIFILLSLFLFKGIFTPGIIIGGDWSMPYTLSQFNKFLESAMYFRNNGTILFGRSRFIFSNAWPYVVFLKFIFGLGFLGDLASKLLLISLFTFALYSMFILLNYFGINKKISLLGSIIYITSPLFFNYAIMGWQFVLFTLGLLPFTLIAFIKSVEKDSKSGAILVGILYSVATIQSQAIIWYALIFLIISIYLVSDKKSFYKYIKIGTIILITFVLLNLYWLLPLIMFPIEGILSSDMINSTISLGTLGNFYPINIIRTFGGLYNYQFETIIASKNLYVFSFITIFIGIFSIFKKENIKLTLSIWLIALVPFFMFLLNYKRELLVHIPFSNVIRDFARFSTLSTFAYAILFTFGLQYLVNTLNNKVKKITVIVIIITYLIFIQPWYIGDLIDRKSTKGPDIRIRTETFPDEYFELENYFAKQKLDQKSIYYPIYGTIDVLNNPKFHGEYQEIQDIFASFSPIPGVMFINDRNTGYLTDFLKIYKAIGLENIYNVLKITNINYVVIRKNMKIENYENLLKGLENHTKKGDLQRVLDNKELLVYRKNIPSTHFFIPEKNYIIGTTKDFESIIGSNIKANSALFITKHNPENIWSNNSYSFTTGVNIEYKKINPTRYKLRFHNVKKDFPLIFSETYDYAWKLYWGDNQQQPKTSILTNLNNYKTFEYNEQTQANIEEIRTQIQKGFITNLDSEPKYISKSFSNMIQNDNLPDGKLYDTWFANPISQGVSHQMVNAYANGWVFNTDKLCSNSAYCIKNSDGSYDFEIIIDYYPQRYYYLLYVSGGLVLLFFVNWLVFSLITKKPNEI